jgi:undecaprenyl pyrophosphate phosphatase UppP
LIQCLSLWPGFSRSGSTISGGVLLGLSHRAAADFTFIMAVPIMAGASLLSLVNNWEYFNIEALPFFIVGFLSAGFTIAEYEREHFMDWIIMRSYERVIDLDWLWDWNDIILPALVAFPLIGISSWVSHGFTRSFSKWVFTVQYALVAIAITYFQIQSYVIGVTLWAYLAVFAVFALISALIAHKNDVKKLRKHSLIMVIILTITILSGLL